MASMAITAATPKMIPNAVSSERILLRTPHPGQSRSWPTTVAKNNFHDYGLGSEEIGLAAGEFGLPSSSFFACR